MLEFASKNAGYIVSLVASLGIIIGWVIKPIKSISLQLKSLDQDVGNILCSQLVREHDYFVTKGYCPSADKVRIEVIYRQYKARGRNHLADTFMDEILKLPNQGVNN